MKYIRLTYSDDIFYVEINSIITIRKAFIGDSCSVVCTSKDGYDSGSYYCKETVEEIMNKLYGEGARSI